MRPALFVVLFLGACVPRATVREAIALDPEERVAMALAERQGYWRNQSESSGCSYGMPNPQLDSRPPPAAPSQRDDGWPTQVRAADPARWARYARAYPTASAYQIASLILSSQPSQRLSTFVATGEGTYAYAYDLQACCVLRSVHGTATANADGTVVVSEHVERDRDAPSKCPQ